MGEKTKIEWTDHTASPWYGCEKVAEGCVNCYAAAMARRNPAVLGEWGPDGHRPKSKSFLKNLERWNAHAEKAGKPASVFPSWCDPFEDRPDVEEWRREMFDAADRLRWIRLLLLTKRPQFIDDMWPLNRVPPGPQEYRAALRGEVSLRRRHNVWLGTSIACRKDLCNIRTLKMCRDLSPVLFLSLEPLIEDLGTLDLTGIDWVIVGGESGPGARPYILEAAWGVILQCKAAGVPCFHKQLGSFPVTTNCNIWEDFEPEQLSDWGDYAASARIQLKHNKGGDWEEWPEELRVRQMPEVLS